MQTTASTAGRPKQEAIMFKLRLYRAAMALSSLAALLMAVGADHKWG
jgi:hypothetical protein